MLKFGNILLNEVLTPLQWVGVTITLISIYLINQRESLGEQNHQEALPETINQTPLEIPDKQLKPLKIKFKQSEPEIFN